MTTVVMDNAKNNSHGYRLHAVIQKVQNFKETYAFHHILVT